MIGVERTAGGLSKYSGATQVEIREAGLTDQVESSDNQGIEDLTDRLSQKSTPPVFRDANEAIEKWRALTRQARESFLVASKNADEDLADSSYREVVDTIEELWTLAELRAQPSRDLLGLLDAALKHREIGEFSTAKRTALYLALDTMAKPFVSQSDYEGHVDSFLDAEIDTFAPVRERRPQLLRLRVEETR